MWAEDEAEKTSATKMTVVTESVEAATATSDVSEGAIE